ncbi:pilus assembly protein [Noviherbaspirillum denitrificans]|uniref:Pilus assembly protein n=1 Tax=Noviherbaspirillum denitrificans TaxID=1968433 RepID=A0A254TEY2_9BURK|nr:pilus assembly protein [Noviherbaspirillum denitrificans]OWW19103.1 hypothetical protein AYR66_05965 [Noviherbaspirillum denitrificans]
MQSATQRLVILAGAAVLAACAPLTPELDKHFGESVRILNAQQTLNPQASSNTAQVQLDGRAAHEALGRYQKSFAAPTPQPNVFTIGVGSGSGGGGGK